MDRTKIVPAWIIDRLRREREEREERERPRLELPLPPTGREGAADEGQSPRTTCIVIEL